MYKCSLHGYQLRETCKTCSKKCQEIKLPKFSLEDKYGKHRREQKFMDG